VGTVQLEIPSFPVLLPLGIVLMVVSAAVLHRRGSLTGPRLGAAWFAGWYAVAVLGATMLPTVLVRDGIRPDFYRIILWPIFTMRPDDFVLNIVMMLPLAAVLRTVFGVRDKRRVVLTGFLISLAIELTQLALMLTLHGNRWADTNDLISNTLGAWLGYLAFRRLLRREGVRRFVDRAELRRTQVDATRS
jgi:glycopeptide antibiotics resistance protein